jgi:uncharacterized Zn-finger protein
MKSQILCPYQHCCRSYSGRKNLERHIQIEHTDPNKYKCNVCQKILSSKQNYKEHMYIHSGLKPYSCGDCGMLFRQGSQLCAHKRIHKALKKTLVRVQELNDGKMNCSSHETLDIVERAARTEVSA